jgi:hypothetical protein
MATTTPNFGWSVPTSSDLVKNGAVAIETLGDSIDASLVDLKGGTTGQVLAKASNTDLDFVWAADAGAPTSLGYAAGKNKIINGDFGIWQRGTSFTLVSGVGAYTADRFSCYNENVGGSAIVSRQAFTPATAPVAGYEGQYFLRWTQTAGTSSANGVITQNIEDVRTYAGQTVTLSYWAKADASRTVTVAYEQYMGASGSGYVNATITTQALTTSWVRYTHTFAVPSLSGKTLGANSYLAMQWKPPTNTTQTIDIWGVQLEAGSTATAFQTATGTLQGELAACQRYYYRVPGEFETTVAPSGSSICVLIPLPVTMRIVPSASTNVSNASYSTSPSTNQWGLVQAQISWSTKSGTVTVTLVSTQTTGTLQLGAATFSPVPNSIKIIPDRILEFNAEL